MDTFATLSALDLDVTDTEYWAQNGSTHGHVLGEFEMRIKRKRKKEKEKRKDRKIERKTAVCLYMYSAPIDTACDTIVRLRSGLL